MSVRDRVLAAKAFEELVDGPAGKVLVRGLTVTGKDSLQQSVLSGQSWRPGILRACCYDPETGERVFRDDDDLSAVPAQVTEPYVDAAIRLSALPTKEIEELEGNSGGTLSNGTGSA